MPLAPGIVEWIAGGSNVQRPYTRSKRFWLMQTLGNFGEKDTLLFYIFCPLPCLKLVSVPLRGIFINAANKFSIFQKKIEYCSQHNVLYYEYYHCQTKLFSSSYLFIIFKVQLSSEYVLKQEFKLKYAKNYVIFIEKS